MKLLYTDTAPLADPRLWERALACSLASRRKYALAYRFPKDQRLSIAAGLLLSRLMLDEGLAPEKAGIRFSHSVKPEMPGHPGWHFNLAHSGRIAVCMLGDYPCGVDVETESSFEDYDPAHILTYRELMQVEGLPDRARPPLVARFWARKEAFLKCLGIGLSLEPRNLSTVPSIHVPMRDGNRFALRDYRLEGHALAACLPDGIPFPELESIAMEALVASLERDRAKQEQAEHA